MTSNWELSARKCAMKAYCRQDQRQFHTNKNPVI